jgi:chromosome segregation ATPase
MRSQSRMAPEIKHWAARLAVPLRDAWRGRPGSEARRTVGKIGFWIAQPGLDAAYQRHLVALQKSRRAVAEVATSRKRLELQIAELERQANQAESPAAEAGHEGVAGQGNDPGEFREQLAELRRQHADMQVSQDQAAAVSRRLMTEISAFRASKEATKTAYEAAEEAAKAVWQRAP